MLTLSGIVIVIVGFALRFNPLLVVVVAGIVTGLAGGLPVEKFLLPSEKHLSKTGIYPYLF